MRKITALAALLVTALVTLLSVTGTASAAAGEGDFVSRTNAARAAAGRSAYTVKSDLVTVARRQAARMAAKGAIWHNPNLGSEVTGWKNVGENVGMGTDVNTIHNAFMDSPTHRANILDTDFREVGIGTAVAADGTIYVAEVFRNPVSSTTVAAAPARPRPVVRSVTSAARPAAAPVVAPAPARAVNVRATVNHIADAARLADLLTERSAAAAAAEGGVPQAIAFADTMAALSA
jgi:hypothetical protein